MSKKAHIAILVSGGGTNLQAILDAKAASRLLEGENPVGAILEIRDEPYTVIGVVELVMTNSLP